MGLEDYWFNWVESHKLERDDGKWETEDGQIFETEELIDDYLWNFAIENVNPYI